MANDQWEFRQKLTSHPHMSLGAPLLKLLEQKHNYRKLLLSTRQYSSRSNFRYYLIQINMIKFVQFMNNISNLVHIFLHKLKRNL